MSEFTGARIRELRADLSHARFARIIGVTKNAVVKWEAGGGIGFDHVVKVAHVFGKPLEWFCPPPEWERLEIERFVDKRWRPKRSDSFHIVFGVNDAGMAAAIRTRWEKLSKEIHRQ